MKEHGILFSSDMVKALLAGRKTQTRRMGTRWLRVKKGHRLWVRETFIDGWPSDGGDIQQHDADGNELPIHVWYCADFDPAKGWVSNRGAEMKMWVGEDGRYRDNIPWKSPIHMPHKYCRIKLEATADARLERLQDISEAGAGAEGICAMAHGCCDRCNGAGRNHTWPAGCPECHGTLHNHRARYERLWDKLHPDTPWESNPEVVVLAFRTLEEPTRA